MLVGNKSDRTDRTVTTEEGRSLADELKMPFLETSARTAENVDSAFLRMAEQLLEAKLDAAREDEKEKVDFSKKSTGSTGGGGCKCG
jgi:GTPase SAR1 family protein